MRVAAKKIAVVKDPIGARDIPAGCVDANCAGGNALAVGDLTVDAIGDETHRAESSETAPGLRLDDSATVRCLKPGAGAMVVQPISGPARYHPPLGQPGERHPLQRVHYACADADPLMAVQDQRTEVTELG